MNLKRERLFDVIIFYLPLETLMFCFCCSGVVPVVIAPLPQQREIVLTRLVQMSSDSHWEFSEDQRVTLDPDIVCMKEKQKEDSREK